MRVSLLLRQNYLPFLGVWTLVSLLSATAQNQLLERKLEGTLNGKIPIRMTLTQDGTALFGSMVYVKKGIPITVIGTLYDENLLLHELMPDGTVTGIYSATAKGKAFVGSWMSPKNPDKELRLQLNETQQKQVPKPSLADLTGTYYYSFGEESAFGELLVKQEGKTLSVAINCITGGPSFHMAIIEKTQLSLAGNTALYATDEYGKCRLLITFGKGVAQIDYLESAYDCGFGARATAAGHYIRTRAVAPTFPKPMDR